MASEDTRGGAGGASASLQARREYRLPPALAPARRAPSLPASRTGLPDEAFESLTQLQHIYVAHNKVSAPPQAGRQGRSRLGPRSTAWRRAAGEAQDGGHPAHCGCAPRSSPWPPSFCPAPSGSLIWLPTK